jgi:hypothetical protein
MADKFVACFAEGDFEVLEGPFEKPQAHAFARGYLQGAGSYGAETPSAYVVPDDVADMRAAEEDEEAQKAIEVYAKVCLS